MKTFKKHILIIIIGIITILCVMPLVCKAAPWKDRPFQTVLYINPESDCISHVNFQVPPNKWLIIEFASVSGTLNGTGNIALVFIHNGPGKYSIPLSTISGISETPYEAFLGSQQMRIYVEPGSTVDVELSLGKYGSSGCAQGSSFTISISGYLMSSP